MIMSSRFRGLLIAVLFSALCLVGVAAGDELVVDQGDWQIGDDCYCGVTCLDSPWQTSFTLSPESAVIFSSPGVRVEFDVAGIRDDAVSGPGVWMNEQYLGTLGPHNSDQACSYIEEKCVLVNGSIQAGTNTLRIQCSTAPPTGRYDDIVLYQVRLDTEGEPSPTAPARWGCIKVLYR